MRDYFEAKCSNGHYSKLEWNAQLSGKRIQVKCKQCTALIDTLVPSSNREDTLISSPKKVTVTDRALIVVEPTILTKKQEFTIAKSLTVIGRKNASKSPDIAIDTMDRRMSRLHCIIKKYTDSSTLLSSYTITARPKTNGTLLNNELLALGEELYLNDGDVITLGDTKMTFVAYSDSTITDKKESK